MLPAATMKPLFMALLLGLPGAALAASLDIPAGPLLGAAITCAVGSAAGLRLDVPGWLRDSGFVLIGILLGAGIGPGFASDLVRWAPSLVLLLLAQVAILASGSRIVMRHLPSDARTGLLAASPGGISTAIALAIEGRADPTPVLVLQVLRILVLVTLVPPLAFLISPPVELVQTEAMSWGALALLAALAWPAGRMGARLRLPAACLLAGMILSGITHGAGLTHGRPPEPMVFLGFAVAGMTLGSRLTGVRPRDVVRLGRLTLLLLVNAVILSLAFAMAAAWLADLDPGAAWVAFAPGGVEAMAAIGLAMGYDPAFIALHHVVRIVFLTLLVPLIIARLPKSRTS